jgi:integrase
MPRPRTGSAVALWKERGGKRIRVWYATVSYFDENGKRKFERRKPKDNTKTAAKELARIMLQEMDESGPQSFDSAHITFAQLAEHYKETYLIEPEYVDGRKIAGLRNKYDFEKRLVVLKGFFRNQKIRSITYSDLKRYRSTRLKTPIVVGKNTRGTEAKGNPTTRQRSIATVNRELSLLRKVFNVAVENGWILKNPFSMGSPLIVMSEERPRERILSKEEEERLLAACTEWRAHLKLIIIMALDTGMRRGEMFKLKWADIDFESRLINIQAFNTKTMRERQVALSTRLAQELQGMWERSNIKPDELVFGITTSVKTAFNKVKRIAGIPDLRFHDLRHTHATRLVSKHLPLSEVGRALGHTQANTTYRYVNPNVETARRVASILDDFNSAEDTQRIIH